MPEDVKNSEVEEDYKNALAELTTNNKPMITMLTMLAEENKEYAPLIVNVVSTHIQETVYRLPAMYLIDSIVKNVGTEYKRLFSNVLVQLFSTAFRHAEEKTRKKLYELRITWNEVFPQSRLYLLDATVNEIDPAWPITSQSKSGSALSKPATSASNPALNIHINPKKIKVATLPSPSQSTTSKDLQELHRLQLEKKALEEKRKNVEKQMKQEGNSSDKTKEGIPRTQSSRRDFLSNYKIKKKTQAIHKDHVTKPLSASQPTIKEKGAGTTIHIAPWKAKQMFPGHQESPPVNRDPRLAQSSVVTPKPTQRDPRLSAVSQRVDPRLPPKETKKNEQSSPSSTKLDAIKSFSHALSSHDQRVSHSRPKEKESVSRTLKEKEKLKHKDRKEFYLDKKKEDIKAKEFERHTSTEKAQSKSKSLAKIKDYIAKSSEVCRQKDIGMAREIEKSKEKEKPKEREISKESENKSKDREIPKEIAKPKEVGNKEMDKTRESESKAKEKNGNKKFELDSTSKKDKDKEKKKVIIEKEKVLKKIPKIKDSQKTQESLPSTSTTFIDHSSSTMSTPPITEKSDSEKNIKTNSQSTQDNDQSKETLSTDISKQKRVASSKEEPKTNDPKLCQKSVELEGSADGNSTNKETDSLNEANSESDESDHYDANRPPPPPHSHKKDKVQRESQNASLLPSTSGDIDLRPLSAAMPMAEDNKMDNSKIVSLFGKEDVDLRRLGPPSTTFAQQHKSLNPPLSRPLPLGVVPCTKDSRESAKGTLDHDELFVDAFSSKKSQQSMESTLPDRLRRPAFNTPNSESWEKFRDKNPKFREYHRQASLTEFLSSQEDLNSDIKSGEQRKDSDERGRWIAGSNVPDHVPGPNPSPMPSVIGQHVDLGRRAPFRGGGHVHSRQNRIQDRRGRRQGFRGREITWKDEWTDEPDLPEVSDEMVRSVARENEARTTEIDGMQREIRIYGNKAMILLDWNDPTTIAFEPAQCDVVFEEDKLRLPMFTGEDYKEFILNGIKHLIKLGVPSQELFINGKGYQCFFGGKPIAIYLGGKNRTVRLISGSRPPQVDIGLEKNTDYVLGRIELIIQPEGRIIPLFLDAKPQHFYIDGKAFIVNFMDCFKSVSINGILYQVDFGGLPLILGVRGKRRYLSFSALPANVIQGETSVLGMDQDHSRLFPIFPQSPSQAPRFYPPASMGSVPRNRPPFQPLNTPRYPIVQQHLNAGPPMRPVTHPMQRPPLAVTPGAYSSGGTTFNPVASSLNPQPLPSFTTNSSVQASAAAPITITPQVPPVAPIDINSLLGKLTASGLIGNKKNQTEAPRKIKTSEKSNKKPSTPTEEEEEIDDLKDFPHIREMFNLDNLRKKRFAIIKRMYRGMQCSSCGLRYPPDQLTQYSNHLDWHFRMNKKQQESTKKPNSRKFYHCIDDWIQYEEIEDVDERVPSMFEEGEDNSQNQDEEETIPSVTVSSDNSLGVCPMCHETFDQFYHHNTEDWHYKHCIAVDGINYHPACHQDLLKAQKQEEEKRQNLEEQKKKEEAEAEKDKEEMVVKEKEEEENKNGDNHASHEVKTNIENTNEAEQEEDNDDVILEANKDDEIEEVPKEERVYETIKIDDDVEENVIDSEDESSESKSRDSESDSESDSSSSSTSSQKSVTDRSSLNIPTVPTINDDSPAVRIKEEPTENGTEMRVYVQRPIPQILADIPIKMEISDDEDDIPPMFEIDDNDTTAHLDQGEDEPIPRWRSASTVAETDIASSIDGNTELVFTPENSQPATTAPKIKISVSVPLRNNTENEEEMTPGNGILNSLNGMDDFTPPPFTFDPKLKPSFEGVELLQQPVEYRGMEVSSLCSIM